MKTNSNMIIYKSNDGKINIDVIMENETVWLNQIQLAELFEKSKSTINEHILNIFKEGELIENQVTRKIGISDFSTKPTIFYNLDVIISVGYRVKSLVGTQFRIWATNHLKEYMIKGFTMNDEFLKNNSRSVYFEELLARIRDIRSSEKEFWRKVLDIYATSIDYDSRSPITIEIFKTIQNKMHYAVHGNTAAEVIFNRVDAEKENIGLTNYKGDYPTKQEVEIAKNYLLEEELTMLNRMVSAYLDVAEINALNLHPMKMEDWAKELDNFLTMTRKDILKGKGLISHEKALKKAHEEYNKYITKTLTQAEKDYIEIINNQLKKLN